MAHLPTIPLSISPNFVPSTGFQSYSSISEQLTEFVYDTREGLDDFSETLFIVSAGLNDALFGASDADKTFQAISSLVIHLKRIGKSTIFPMRDLPPA